MPRVLQLQNSYPEQVHCMTLNLDHDDPDVPPDLNKRNEVKGQLLSLNMTIENLMSREPTEAVLKHFDLFSLPATLVFDQSGSLAKSFEGDFGYEEDVLPAVNRLVKNRANSTTPPPSQ